MTLCHLDVDSFAGTDDAKIAAANAAAKALPTPSRMLFPARRMNLTVPAILDPPDFSVIDMRGCLITTSANLGIQIGSALRNTLNYQVLGANVSRAAVDAAGGSTGISIRNACNATIQATWVRDHTYGILLYADQANGGVSHTRVDLGIIHDNTHSIYCVAAGPGYINENTLYGGSFNHSSLFPKGVPTVHLEIPDGTPANNNSFIRPSFEDGQPASVVQAMLFGSMAVANTVVHPRWENNPDQGGPAIRFRPGSYANQIIGVGNYLKNSNVLDESGGRNSWQMEDGDYIARRVSALEGSVQTLYTWWESGAKLQRFLDVDHTETGWIKNTGDARFRNLRLAPSSFITPDAGEVVFEATSNTSVTLKYRGTDGIVRSGPIPVV